MHWRHMCLYRALHVVSGVPQEGLGNPYDSSVDYPPHDDLTCGKSLVYYCH